ncbi:MAG TPA: contact-dependent growth inhibition system immunity protein [Candidatus Dormibacteraeota bacterium]
MNGTIDTETIAGAAADYPALAQLFGGYFHQDWRQDHASSDEALQAFIQDTSPETATAAANDIDRLLDAGFDDIALARMLADGLDCNYVAETDGVTAPAWLASVRDSLRAAA